MDDDTFRERMYARYADIDAYELTSEQLAFRRDIAPHLPSDKTTPIIDIGCGQGHVVGLLIERGYDEASGVDVSPSQVAEAHAAGRTAVIEGDFRSHLVHRPGYFGAIIATDLLEHLSKPEVLETMDAARAALRPGGCFITRVPNGVSPFNGNYQHGDFTHETAFTARSINQVALAAGFSSTNIYPCPPIAHGAKSVLRSMAWKAVAGVYKAALTSETGILRGHIVTQNLVAVARRH